MVTVDDGKPLVDEATARLDLAGEYGVLFANFRNATLENQELAKRLQTVIGELNEVRTSCVTLGEKLRDTTTKCNEYADRLRKRKKA